MAIFESVDVRSGHASWQHDGTLIETPYAIAGDRPEIILTTGFGERDLGQIAKGLGERGVALAVTRVTYPTEGELTPDIMQTAIEASTLAVISEVNIDSGRVPEAPVIGVGNSKGASEQMAVACRHPERWQRLIPVAPLGINNAALGSAFVPFRRALYARARAEGLLDVQPSVDSTSPRELGREFMAGLQYAFSQDGPATVKGLYERGLLDRIYAGEDDGMFPPAELEAALGMPGIIERVKDTGHVLLLTEQGLDNMAEIIHAATAFEPESLAA